MVSIAITCGSLVAAEGLLRLVDPAYFERQPAASLDRIHRYSEVYGWELKPGARQHEDDHWVSVNGLGFRGAEVPRQARSARRRVVLLGDSITFGTYVGDGETFSDALAAGGEFETVNLAVQGYGPGQSMLKLEREGLRYEPELVVFNVCLANDFVDVMLPSFLYDARHPKPFFRLRDGALALEDAHLRLRPRARLGRWLAEHSQLYARASSLLAGPRVVDEGAAEAARGDWVARRRAVAQDEPAALELGLAILARMRASVERAGATFVVVVHPDKDAFKHGSPLAERLERAPELAGVTVVDMAREYRRARLTGRELMLDSIGHLSAAGHRHAGAVLAGFLRHLSPTMARAARTPRVTGG